MTTQRQAFGTSSGMSKVAGMFGALFGGHRDAAARAPEGGAGAKPVPVADLPKPAPDDLANWHLAARIALSAALFGVGVYMLSNYMRALVWAVVLAIALWPLFERAAARVGPRMRGEVLPLLFTAMVALIFVVPFVLLGVEAAREAHTVLDTYKQAEANGIPVPDAVNKLPEKIAQPVSNWWNENLAHSGWAKDLAEKVDTASNRELGKNVGRDAVHRVVLFGFALLALFFLFKEGHSVVEQARAASHRIFGPRGERIGRQVISSIHGTVNGLVLVGLGEGVVLGVVYFFAGVPHPILFGAFTAVAAMIPFAAAVAIVLAAGAVLAAGKTIPAVVILGAGFLTTFSADHFVRPSLIGGTTRLPFIWVLLGILGGVETFGLLGLFVGPAVMAALILLWREMAGDEAAN
jgi:predicted PurR-regulated permease PerM